VFTERTSLGLDVSRPGFPETGCLVSPGRGGGFVQRGLGRPAMQSRDCSVELYTIGEDRPPHECSWIDPFTGFGLPTGQVPCHHPPG